MPLKLDDKRAIVSSVNDIATKAHSAIVTVYSGMTVSEMTQLRENAREAGVYVRVVKNTLARRALVDTQFECLQDILVGQVFLAFSMDEPSAAARVIKDFIKANTKLVVKGIALSGQLLEASAIDTVAKLPTYPEAIAMLMSVMQAPITRLVQTIQEPHAKLVRTVAALNDSKT